MFSLATQLRFAAVQAYDGPRRLSGNPPPAVRVLQYALLPGALDHWHTHPPRVGYVLSGAKIRVTDADGSHQDYDEKTGDNYWADFSPLHDTLNIGTTPYIALLVEVKSASAKAPAAK